MPPAQGRTGPDVSIVLEPTVQRGYYSPGDTIIGRVVRTSFVVSPNAMVTVRLYGRAKVKITVRRRNGQTSSTSHYRNRFNFWGTETLQLLHSGVIHLPQGGDPLTWPFALTIPATASPATVRFGNKQEFAWGSILPENILRTPIPSSFYSESHGWDKKFEAFVEYYLEAELRAQGVSKATCPIKVITPHEQYPVPDFRLLSCRAPSGKFKTPRLVPGQEGMHITFKEKVGNFFHSSRVPQLVFKFQIQLPSVIQLDHHGHVPLLVRLAPDRQLTSDIIADVPIPIHLVALNLKLRSTTGTTAPGSLGVTNHTAAASEDYPFGGMLGSWPKSGQPVRLPLGENEPPLDVGSLMGLRVDSIGFVTLGGTRRLMRGLYPDFQTWCIRHSNLLCWEMRLEAARETTKFQGQQKLSILAPSAEKSPPTQIMAPVPYQEVVGESSTAGSSGKPTYEEATCGDEGDVAPPYKS